MSFPLSLFIRLLIVALIATGSLVAPKAAKANLITNGNWTLQGTVNQSGTWSSNPLMSVNGSDSTWGSSTGAALSLKSTTPLSQFSLDETVDDSIFDKSSLDTVDTHTSSSYSTKNERWNFKLGGNLDTDTTRTSEVATIGAQPTISKHLGYSLSPNVSFAPTQADTFSLGGSFSASEYDSGNYSDYRVFSISPSYGRKFDLYNSGNISFSAREYRTTNDNKTKTESFSPNVGWTTIFSDRLVGSASIGGQTSRQYNYGVITDEGKWSLVFSGSLSYSGQQGSFSLSAARSQQPSGDGTDSLQTSLTATQSYAINPRLSLNGGISYITATYPTTPINGLDSLVSGNLGASYKVTDWLAFTVSYKYQYKTLTNDAGTADDHSISFGLSLSSDVWSLSE
ncbi:MAG: outer membrane beta-barrel protein [Bdellovibrionales bacterium]